MYQDHNVELGGDLKTITLKILAFQGKNDPENYLELEKKMEWIFKCHNYQKHKKFKLALMGFTDHTIMWQDQLVTNHKRNYKRQVNTWDEMKSLMGKIFVPSHYYRELYKRLQSLSQGIKSVDEYFKEMKLAMIRANIEEDKEATIARFMNGLNYDIAHIIELYH